MLEVIIVDSHVLPSTLEIQPAAILPLSLWIAQQESARRQPTKVKSYLGIIIAFLVILPHTTVAEQR